MRRILKLFLLMAVPVFAGAQSTTIDSLKQALHTEQRDTSRVTLLNTLSLAYVYSRPDTALLLAQQALLLAKKTGFAKGEVVSLFRIAQIFLLTGNYPKALQLNLKALKKAEAIGDEELAARVLTNIGNTYNYQGDYLLTVAYTKKSLAMAESIHAQSNVLNSLLNLGDAYEKLNRLDSALSYTNQTHALAAKQKNADLTGVALNNLGNIYSKLGQEAAAMHNYRLGIPYLMEVEDDDALCETYLGMAALFRKEDSRDSSLYYAKLSLAIGQKGGFIVRMMNASQFLTTYYTAIHNVDSAFVYQSATIAAKDSLFSQEKAREIQNLGYEETVRQQQIEEAKAEAQTQLKFNMLFGGLGTLLLVAFLLYRNNRHKQSANRLLTQQKTKVESTLQELTATQAQLVQSEKMASLGELTAGIAHEIQNPLNFVNNFSEINKEMLAELNVEIDKGNYVDVKALAKNIKANEEKINHHGKRAEAIVKGMLQHSRSSTGVKEPTDINALCDEYLRLSYHGLRAKDKSFNADFKTDFDNSIRKINIIPQDIGRVLLNLINNAFYAVNERRKITKESLPTGQAGYQPTVFLSTKKTGDKVILTVKDNGNGIPQNIVDKIFQPFFTTKPAGEGTGLGLGLSYDIIKAHGGEIKVETKEGEGTEFIIQLPV
jgi:two-component system NtrC family sensor kinase